MSIEEQIDQIIVNHLIEMEKKPYLFFGDNFTIDRLESFLYGYSVCCIDLFGVPSRFLADFNNYVTNYYGDNLSLNACSYVKYKQGSEQAAIHKFFELFHQFLESDKPNVQLELEDACVIDYKITPGLLEGKLCSHPSEAYDKKTQPTECTDKKQ